MSNFLIVPLKDRTVKQRDLDLIVGIDFFSGAPSVSNLIVPFYAKVPTQDRTRRLTIVNGGVFFFVPGQSDNHLDLTLLYQIKLQTLETIGRNDVFIYSWTRQNAMLIEEF